MDYGLQCAQEQAAKIARDIPYQKPSLVEQLEQQAVDLKARLAQIEEALAGLKANPEVERVLNLVSRL
jgi:hypothetical protein